jgi:hypothetical protein
MASGYYSSNLVRQNGSVFLKIYTTGPEVPLLYRLSQPEFDSKNVFS